MNGWMNEWNSERYGWKNYPEELSKQIKSRTLILKARYDGFLEAIAFELNLIG